MPTDSDRHRILCAGTNLKIAARATGRLYDRALVPFDLNTMQYAILSNIARAGSQLIKSRLRRPTGTVRVGLS